MPKRCEERIAELVGEHRRWLSQSKDLVVLERQYLEEDLSTGTFDSIANITISLRILSTYWAVKGTLAVIDGDKGGTRDLERSMIYMYWSVQLRSKAIANRLFLRPIEKGPDLQITSSLTACLWCAGFCFEAPTATLSMGQLLSNMAGNSGLVKQGYWGSRIFEPFVLAMCEISKGSSAREMLDSRDLGPYTDVLSSWGEPEGLGRAIGAICDYHCKNMEDTGGGQRRPEFCEPPFDLLPIEILAVLKLCQQSNISLPEIRHPLLETQIAKIDSLDFEGFRDEFVDRVESFYMELFET